MGNKPAGRKNSMQTPDKSVSRDLILPAEQPAASALPEKSCSALDEYEPGAVISVSSEGELRLGTHRASGERRVLKAMKKMDFEEHEIRATVLRARIHSRLSHPHIVKIVELFNDDKYLTLVYEFVEGGNLFDVLHQSKRYSEREAAQIVGQLLHTLAYLHESRIVHRDVKPENLMYNARAERITLISMHICVVHYPGKPLTSCRGTPSYMAPETIRERYDEKVDLWACGVVLYAMITGRLPFNAINDDEVLGRVLAGKYDCDAPEFGAFSPHAKELVQSLLAADPARRPSAAEAAQHSWFRQALNPAPIAVNPLKRNAASRREPRIAHPVFKFFVEHITPEAEKEHLREVFRRANASATGALAKAELREALARPDFALSTSDAEHVLTLIEQLQRPIGADEFVNAVLYRKRLITGANIKRCFALLKRLRASNSIEAGDLRQVIFPECDDALWEDVKRMIHKEDEDEVDFYEFRHMLKDFVAQMP